MKHVYQYGIWKGVCPCFALLSSSAFDINLMFLKLKVSHVSQLNKGEILKIPPNKGVLLFPPLGFGGQC